MPENSQLLSFNPWPPVNGSSFQGCIRNLYINNELQDFTQTQMKPGVVPGCQPCQELRCVHGLCQPETAVGPVCRCQSGWGGPHCDQVLLTAAANPCQKNKWVLVCSRHLFYSIFAIIGYSASSLKTTNKNTQKFSCLGWLSKSQPALGWTITRNTITFITFLNLIIKSWNTY